MLLSLILAHSDCVARARGQRPVLLLDEVAAHLDPLRRAALYDRLAGQGGQAWLTGTEAALFDDMPGPVTRFRIAGGRNAAGYADLGGAESDRYRTSRPLSSDGSRVGNGGVSTC